MFTKYEETPEQTKILRQLKDMFSTLPHWRLREVCKANNWNVESCIDQLMNVVINQPLEYNNGNQMQQQLRTKFNKKDSSQGNISKDDERVGSLIRKGYRVLILMRGPPGVGKSHLARSFVMNFVGIQDTDYQIEDFICSSDDYFYNAKGVYRYNPANLSDAHEYNHQRVREKARAGLSPIIVDNTHMQLWEMLPYVKFAVQNNYLIEIVEPKTSWRNSTSMLAQKNKHGVPQNRIQHMLDKYERGSVSVLTKMLKNTKYTMTLPQMRTLPPIKTFSEKIYSEPVSSVAATTADTDTESKVCANTYTTNEPKEQRKQFSANRLLAKTNGDEQSPASSSRDVYSLLEQKSTANAWKPYECESADFWGIKKLQPQTSQPPLPVIVDEKTKISGGEKSLLDLLMEDGATSEVTGQSGTICPTGDNLNQVSTTFQLHSIGCPNEHTAFVALRQIYPNKRVSGLWDLFLKCNGDVDWAVDILLKEDELAICAEDNNIENLIEFDNDDEVFECMCNSTNERSRENLFTRNAGETNNIADNHISIENNVALLNIHEAKPQRQRPRFARSNQSKNPALLEVKGNIENCFVLGDDQYSKHLLKIRNFRSGINDAAPASSNATTTESYENGESLTENYSFKIEDDDDDDDEDEDDNENEQGDVFNEDMLEMSLGEQLVQQLLETFRNESSLEEQISSTLPLNLKVFIPRTLAKQLYMLWIESAYNHMEEERQKLVREDEDFARLLKNPKYSEFKQSPSNLREILDMEYAWNIYNQDKEDLQQQQTLQQQKDPSDLASHLTHMKLCESFPDIPKETLIDILAANGNNYNDTVSVLRSTMQTDEANGHITARTQQHLMDCAREEQELLNQQVRNQATQQQERVSHDWDDNDDTKSSLSQEEAKRLALREFEETRNLAAHHCQLKAECYQKAKEAIQSGNGGAAIYYSQIANLHKKKIDMYNHRAANCIMDVHKYTQNNPDLLDLHYFHLMEALGCLDIFLDRHITGLRIASRKYKHVFIITGRGKHSTGGVSTIKNKVKARLKERCLRWSEVNPGLLKVKIFSGSRHSKNI